ncbi:ABC transporter ATP-binding protein/permease [Granulicatella adiacens]|uniref:ABC transporter, ATP-binding protein n=1 Tax=Granulicatella adiacens ATCC 49175 TaxID=638301 RepID=C8NE80_9LACT|nr:ABC transporter, ATP-binding protein [Granulicatella adiacens ATCC 49175]UAK93886.1 ABC transporter ATP-binding protein/permease [Granulicatella adiacens]
MRKILEHIKRYRGTIFTIIILTVLQVGSTLLTPTILASLVSNGILKQDQATIIQQGGLMLLTTTLDLVLSVTVVRFVGKFSAGLARDLRLSMFNKIQRFSTQDFQKFGTSSYINRTTRDIQSLSQTIGFSMNLILMAPLMFIGSIVLSMRMNFELSLVLLGSIPFLGIAIVLMIISVSKGFTILRQTTDRLTQIIRDTLTGIRVIRAFNKSEYELKRYDEVNEGYRKLLFDLNVKFSLITPIMMITINFANLAVVLVGANLVQGLQLDIGSLMAVIQYSALVLVSLLMLAFIFVMVPQGLVAARRINEVLDQENIQKFVETERGLEKIETVEFNNVSFKYEGAEKEMLKDVNFTAKTGEKIAIIGSTGAGKSTLMNLLLRFLDTSSGELLYNGVNIQDYAEKELRQQIAFVPQNRMLFSGTIRENLKFGNENATDEEMIEALKLAEAWEFVSSLEDGLDAHVEQKGDNFSGGQKQRLSIARALVKKASVHIYDDSFSALDAKTEARLRNNLKKINEDSIVFVVAQRITSVTDATRIIVLNEGEVVGIGTHDELKVSNQIYQEIMNSQSSLEELEDTNE